MPPRPDLHPDDLVTPKQASALLGIPASTVCTWIDRYGIESLGEIAGRRVYDYLDIAAVDARLRRKREARNPPGDAVQAGLAA
jgi:hypothetical protein